MRGRRVSASAVAALAAMFTLVAGGRGAVLAAAPGRSDVGATAIASNTAGRAVAVWGIDDPCPSCADIATRSVTAGRLGPVQVLLRGVSIDPSGVIDPTDSPVAAVAPDGDEVLAWRSVVAGCRRRCGLLEYAIRPATARRFGRPQVLAHGIAPLGLAAIGQHRIALLLERSVPGSHRRRLQIALRRSGTARFSAPVTVTGRLYTHSQDAQVGGDTRGDTFVLWRDHTGQERLSLRRPRGRFHVVARLPDGRGPLIDYGLQVLPGGEALAGDDAAAVLRLPDGRLIRHRFSADRQPAELTLVAPGRVAELDGAAPGRTPGLFVREAGAGLRFGPPRRVSGPLYDSLPLDQIVPMSGGAFAVAVSGFRSPDTITGGVGRIAFVSAHGAVVPARRAAPGGYGVTLTWIGHTLLDTWGTKDGNEHETLVDPTAPGARARPSG